MALLWSSFDKYLRGEHLGGQRRIVTIVHITVEEMRATGAAEEKPVLWFEETKKGLIVSPTNRKILVGLFGDDVSACIGKRVALEAQPLKVAGRMTLPIRISPYYTDASHTAAPIAAPPAALTQPGPAPAPSTASTQAAAAAAEFGALPSQGEHLRSLVTAAEQPTLLTPPAQPETPAKRHRVATPPSGETQRRWNELTDRLADEFPRFRLRSGEVDRLTMLYIVDSLGYPKVDATNLDQVLAELRDHERARDAAPQ